MVVFASSVSVPGTGERSGVMSLDAAVMYLVGDSSGEGARFDEGQERT